ncbi:hypothetical protein ACR9GP_25555 [Enterobacter ludwigii]
MKKIKLPERLYYPLPEAAELLNCSVRDLIHYGAIGVLDICAYVNLSAESLDGLFYIWFSEDVESKIEGDCFYGEWFTIGLIERKDKNDLFIFPGYYAHMVSGFFYLSPGCFVEAEFDTDGGVYTAIITSHPYGFESAVKIIKTPNVKSLIKIDISSMCIKTEDLHSMREKGNINIKNDLQESPKTQSKKTELIESLIKMIPEMADVDLEIESISKIMNLLEATAAQKGVEFPQIHRQTLQIYLGRSKK